MDGDKTMKTNKENDNQKKSRQGKVWPIVLCLLLALGVFALLLNVEARQLAQYEKGNVVVAIADIPEGLEITEKNLGELFAVKERPLTDIPDAAYVKTEELIGQYARSGMDNGSIITKSMLGELRKDFDDSVLLGVNMQALAQSVAGTLRAGDVIDIYTVKIEEDKQVLVEKALANVTIERSYTSSGTAILKEDDTSIAQYITIPVHKDAVGMFYQALENRRIEIVKHPQ